jgi:PAS domain S-box-containing protein
MTSKDRGISREPSRRLSRDLTAVVVSLVLAASAIAISALYLFTTWTEQSKFVQRADAKLAYLQHSLQQPLRSMDSAAVAKLCLAFAQDKELASVVVRDEKGQVIFDLPAISGRELLKRRAIIKSKDRNIGQVEIGMDSAFYQKESQRALLTTGLTVLAVVVVLLVLTGGLAHRLLARFLGDLQRSIERISDGDYEVRKRKIRYQEMASIVERFDLMAARVKRREDSLTVANQQLQDEIAERQRAEEALAQSEQRYRELFDSITDFIYTHDLQGRFITVNQGAASNLGYVVEELTGHHISDFMLPKYKRSFVEEYLPAILREGQHEGISVYLSRDGKKHFIEYRNRLMNKNGKPDHVSGIGRDVTERLRAQEQLRRLEEQLRQSQKMEAVGTLAGGVAHDFNNILQGIRGYAQIISMSTAPNDPMRSHVDQIEAAVGRATALVQQLLTFSRRVQPQLKSINLNQRVEQVVGLLRRTLPKMISIEANLEDGLGPVNADPNQIEQILLNLGANAGDAMPEGGQLRVKTSNQTLDQSFCQGHPDARPGDYVLLQVSDNGCGMDNVTMAHIFDPFFTTKELGKGTGLGLSMVYGIVRNHGGFVIVKSQPGQGTTFSIYLPVAAGEAEHEDAKLQTEMPPGGGESLLLVDDDIDILNSTREVLEHFGYRVRTASSGEEAIEAYGSRHAKYDLVLLDLGMPGMGGAKALEKLKKMDPAAKVIVCSGYSSEITSQTADQGGASAYVSKPYRTTDMLTVIRSVLDKQISQ